MRERAHRLRAPGTIVAALVLLGIALVAQSVSAAAHTHRSASNTADLATGSALQPGLGAPEVQPHASAPTVTGGRLAGRQASGATRGGPALAVRTAGIATGLPPAPDAQPSPARSAPSGPVQTGWAPKTPPLSTPWTHLVSGRFDWGAYPTPQLTRRAWENLNGVWQFAPAVPGQAPPFHRSLAERILVPFPMESALSGIEAHYRYSYYRRTFTIPRSWTGQHVLLHFGAVDWQAIVWVNGRRVGTHRGGYDPFTLDITSALHRRGVQEIVVSVYAPVDSQGEPIGKQRLNPGGIFYTPSSGIWQTTWLEPVPAAHISSLVTTPDLANDTLRVLADAPPGYTVQAIAYRGSTRIASATGPTGRPISIHVRHPRLWSPSDPYLYGLTIRLLRPGIPRRRGHPATPSTLIDAVGSYFGMRSISIAEVDGVPKVELNGSPIFMLGTLDQGYWPDGLYTAPTPAALESDLQTQKALGFNTVRKHMKVEPQLWYYDADRLGMLVWQDMPAMPIATPSPAAQGEFLAELHAMIETHIDAPSIVQWVPFNEGWGEFDPTGVTAAVRRWDPSRLVDSISGFNCCYSFGADTGSVLDKHSYVGPGVQGPAGRQAAEDGEFGGLELSVPGHQWPGTPFGYEREASSQMLTLRYQELLSQVGLEAQHFGLNAAIYTAATDVESETDGLVTYDRRVLKVDEASVRAVNQAVIADGSSAPVPFGTYPSLAAAFDNVGITAAADPIPGNYDGGGQSYQAEGLAAAGLAPGQTVTVDGVSATWPSVAAGLPDNVVAGGQTIDVDSAGSTLLLLIGGTWVPTDATATGTITYTDGTTQPYTVSFDDWAASAPAPSSQILTTSPSNVQAGSGMRVRQVNVYADTVTLLPGKVVSTITLPVVNEGIAAAPQMALHVFALGVG